MRCSTSCVVTESQTKTATPASAGEGGEPRERSSCRRGRRRCGRCGGGCGCSWGRGARALSAPPQPFYEPEKASLKRTTTKTFWGFVGLKPRGPPPAPRRGAIPATGFRGAWWGRLRAGWLPRSPPRLCLCPQPARPRAHAHLSRPARCWGRCHRPPPSHAWPCSCCCPGG